MGHFPAIYKVMGMPGRYEGRTKGDGNLGVVERPRGTDPGG